MLNLQINYYPTHAHHDTTRLDSTRHGTTRLDTTRLDTIRHDTTRHDTSLIHSLTQILKIIFIEGKSTY